MRNLFLLVSLDRIQEGMLQVLSITSLPILSAEDLHLRSPAGLECSPSMPHLEPYWKDGIVFQASDSLMTLLGFCSHGLAMSYVGLSLHLSYIVI